MSVWAFLALVIYAFGVLGSFVLIARWIERDERRVEARGKERASDWMNGCVSLVAAIFWPVIVIAIAMGRLYSFVANA